MAKHGLGRGLGALIPDGIPGIQEMGAGSSAPVTAPLGRLRPNPRQPRKDFSEESLKELAESIKEHGIIQPILVEEDSPGGYLIVAGERRWRAAGMAGLREVPVLVRAFTDQQRLEIALIENIQREDLNAVEEALGYRSLMEISGQGQEEVARRVGKNRSTVANALRLLKLPEEMLAGLREGKLSAGHARAILAVLNPADQQILYKRITEEGISVREAEDAARSLNGGGRAAGGSRKASASSLQQPEIRELEQKFINALGTKVSIGGNGKRGRLSIDYYSADDLDRIWQIVSANAGAGSD